MMEDRMHDDSTFVTLTYSDENMPKTFENRETLDPRHTELFLKSFRKHMDKKHGKKIRYYLVGEYGDKSGRPHYHLALFGYKNCLYGQSQYSKIKKDCCSQCDTIRDIWKRGNIYLGEINKVTAAYICGYVIKKMTDINDPRLKNQHPEFARRSLKPGIGAPAMELVARTIQKYGLEDLEDVPNELRVGGKLFPLGNYLVKRLRKELDRDEKIPQAKYDHIYAEMLEMLQKAVNDEENPSPLHHIQEANVQKIRKVEGREKLYRKRGSI